MKKILLCLMLCFVLFSAVAEQMPVPGLYHYVLENGLEIYIMENSSAPLAYIEIALRAGGIAQIPETAGLFHLYEHMMFKGNSLYPDAAAVQTAISSFGVSSWNGSTGSEFVNYYFTVPSYKLSDGMKFWAAAVRTPLLDSNELESEKKVVLSEINGSFATSTKIQNSAVMGALFPDFPWRLDPAGDPAAVENATVEQLKTIKDTYYVPDNAALFIGGDVKHNEVYELAEKYFGSWQKAAPRSELRRLQNPAPFAKPMFMVYPDPEMSDRLASVRVYYRGPDTVVDTKSTYAADVWGDLLSNPQGRFTRQMLADSQLGIPDPRYVGGGYATNKESGMIIFQAVLTNPDYMLPLRAEHFLEKLQNEEIPAMIQNSDYFTATEYADVKQRIDDNQIISRETAAGYLAELRFWWAATSGDYFMNYHKNMQKTESADIASFLAKYVENKHPLVLVTLNPQVFAMLKQEFQTAGFTEISADNAYWWKKDGK